MSKAFFEENGFLIVDGILHPTELQSFAHCVRALESYETDGERYDALAGTPEFMTLVANVQIRMKVNELMGRDWSAPLYGFTNRCRIDPPHDNRRTYGWHQEVFYTIPGSRFIQTWAPLVHDTTVENGTIEICPGSHKEGIAKQTWTDPPGRAAQIIVNPDVVAKYPSIRVPMKLGQVLFFDSRLFHRSGQNTSDQTRYSLVGMYHAIERGFRAPKIQFEYRGKTPRQWFEEVQCSTT